MVCAEPPRIKVMETVRKDYGEREKDKNLSQSSWIPPGKRHWLSPVRLRTKGKDSESMDVFSDSAKCVEIVSGNEDEPKTGSFFGSEFSYEDLEQSVWKTTHTVC